MAKKVEEDDPVSEKLQSAERRYFGFHTSYTLDHDPKHILFSLARYKFAAKMLAGLGSVLEVGFGDGLGANLLAQVCPRVVGIDCDSFAVQNHVETRWVEENIEFVTHDITKEAYPEKFDAVYSLDVIEHIEPSLEDKFFKNIILSSKDNGILIMGAPNKTAARYASPNSQKSHINLKDHDEFKETLSKYYRHVFMFGMNDEILHTGYPSMCHYLIGLAVGPSSSPLS
jgi:2-polyprenyl-3-methyl-5-hydroxy-6-metoxy-1,4-benzoquinol methylase